MEPTTPNTVSPCNVDNVNRLGAKFAILFYFMFVLNLSGNALVLVIIHRFEKLTNVSNIFLLNLVLSSIIFMSTLPFIGVYNQLSNWIFGNIMCKIVFSVYNLGFYSSVLFLTLLTFDRHLAVVYSLKTLRIRNRKYAVVSCFVVWLISFLACIPQMISATTIRNNLRKTSLCFEFSHNLTTKDHLRRQSGFYIQLFIFLILPLSVIIYCYVRIAITVVSSGIVTKFKTLRLIFIIVLFFFLSWIPFNVVRLLPDDSCEQKNRKISALHITRNFAYIYFCISPIFYTFVGKKFQNYFRLLLVKHFPGLRKYISVTPDSRTSATAKSTSI